MINNIEIIGGGTVSHVRNHLALTAPAYGNTARKIHRLLQEGGHHHDYNLHLNLTKMANAGSGNLETNQDVSELVDQLLLEPLTKIIFFNPALVDYDGFITESATAGSIWRVDNRTESGKYVERLKTSEGEQTMSLLPSAKVLSKIRKTRKDIFLVAFKTTCGATEDEQFLSGLHLLKANSCNLVLANDTKTRMNMIITPEQARYEVTSERAQVLRTLVEMTLARSSLTFTRSIVEKDSQPLPWNNSAIPESLRKVVNHCIAQGAYKPFNGATVGHFAARMPFNNWIATSMRKTDFNKLDQIGLVLCKSQGPNEVLAFGGKPSVGGQSQRIIFKEHPDLDCIVHFHCPPKPHASISTRQQKLFECGSHECGQNTSDGLRAVQPGIKCVYLDNHGPNIVFDRNIDPQKVIDFIDANFDLKASTDQVKRDVPTF